MENCQVTFLPEEQTVEIAKGSTILEAAQKAGIPVRSACGGQGTCGRCAVKIESGEASGVCGNLSQAKRDEGWVTACTMKVESNLRVLVPLESRLHAHQVLMDDSAEGIVLESCTKEVSAGDDGIMVSVHQLKLTEPTLTDNTSDLTRLLKAVKAAGGYDHVSIALDTLSTLPSVLRADNWRITVSAMLKDNSAKIIRVKSGYHDTPPYGIALDIGTTTVVLELVDMMNGKIIAQSGAYNRQAAFGDDVITRIFYTEEEKNGLANMQKAVLDTINDLLDQVYAQSGIDPLDVFALLISGNTTMCHLFYGIDPRYLHREPYIPATVEYPYISAAKLGLRMNPVAKLITFPSVASYVGGDIVSGSLLTGIEKQEEIQLFIDIGTNGEMVLGNSDWLMCCACSAGPAFEGGGIACGMRAMDGAIDKIEVDKDHEYMVQYSTINNGKPMGLCGSGLIDALSKLRMAGVIDRQGNMQTIDSWRYRDDDGEKSFVIAAAEESGTGEDIIITEGDVKDLIRAKAAVFAGIRCMLKMVDLSIEAIDHIIISGGFGTYINLKEAIRIGFLPDLPHERYEFIGNSSLKGAYRALMSKKSFLHAIDVSKSMTYLELSLGNDFMDEYESAMFLPHTDLSLFPSVQD